VRIGVRNSGIFKTMKRNWRTVRIWRTVRFAKQSKDSGTFHPGPENIFLFLPAKIRISCASQI
jgi:hypothetical protein